MKQIFYTVLMGLPLHAAAQPTITKMENHSIGTVVKYINDTTSNLAPGPAGPNQTWTFTAIAPQDTSTMRIISPASTSFGANFPDASIVRVTDDNNYVFIQKTATDNYLVGGADSASGTVTTYYDKSVFAQHPLTYLKSVNDDYTSINTSVSTDTSKGNIQALADAWGTVVLPNGTYPNTIRVKLLIHQVDSIQAGPAKIAGILDATTYLWYDNQHYSAIMRWDSTHYDFTFGQIQRKTVSYLVSETYPVSVNEVAKPYSCSASLTTGRLAIYGGLVAGRTYTVSLHNLNGKQLLQAQTAASAAGIELPVHADLPAAMYLATLYDITGRAEVIRVVKQ